MRARFFVLLFCFGFGGVVARFFGGILSLIIIIAIKTVVDLLLQVKDAGNPIATLEP